MGGALEADDVRPRHAAVEHRLHGFSEGESNSDGSPREAGPRRRAAARSSSQSNERVGEFAAAWGHTESQAFLLSVMDVGCVGYATLGSNKDEQFGWGLVRIFGKR